MSLTLGIIKPDAVESGKAGNILAHLEASGFTVRALRMTGMNTATLSTSALERAFKIGATLASSRKNRLRVGSI